MPERVVVGVCDNLDCFEKGGREVRAKLEEAFEGDDRVRVIATTCLQQCTKGPNAIITGDNPTMQAPVIINRIGRHRLFGATSVETAVYRIEQYRDQSDTPTRR